MQSSRAAATPCCSTSKCSSVLNSRKGMSTPLATPAALGRAVPLRSARTHLIRPQQQTQQQPERSLVCRIWPFDAAWGVSVDTATLTQKLPQDLFAISLFPYLAFLFFLHRSRQMPGLALFGFYFLLVFVGASIPAGIYAKTVYRTSLANVDWLHGGAESLLTVTNLLIVLGMRNAIRAAEEEQAAAAVAAAQQQQPGASSGADAAPMAAAAEREQ